MFPPFDEERAKAVCLQMKKQLKEGSLVLESLSPASKDRVSNALMLGALVCTDSTGNEVVLKAVSGIRSLLKPNPSLNDNSIYVPPIASFEQIQSALAKNDKEIHSITETLKTEKHLNPKEQKALVEHRTLLTTQSLKAVHKLYNFYCADGKVYSLNDICKKQIEGKFPPTGTGDCCAPKLLNYAFSHFCK